MARPKKKGLPEIVTELGEQFLGFFTRKPDKEGLDEFRAHQQRVAVSATQMDGGFIREYPEFIGMILLGMLRVTSEECREFLAFMKDPNEETFQELRQSGTVQLQESVRPVWSHLLEQAPDITPLIVAACIQAQQSREIKLKLQNQG